MNIRLPDGKYVLAISGGVDSVVLLDVLVDSNPDLIVDGKLLVAHFDHGIRQNSSADAKFVESLANGYGLNFVVGHGGLGEGASEEVARKHRYEFLEKVKKDNHASAIITAHHKDDVVETAIINLMRGTGRRGLVSLASKEGLLRPLLQYHKAELIDYAKGKNLSWREDETNSELHYLRNRVRHSLEQGDKKKDVEKLLNIIEQMAVLNNKIDHEINRLLFAKLRRSKNVLPKRWFYTLPHDLACEVIHVMFRNHKINDLSSKLVDNSVIFIKTAKVGKRMDLDKNNYLLITKRSARFIKR